MIPLGKCEGYIVQNKKNTNFLDIGNNLEFWNVIDNKIINAESEHYQKRNFSVKGEQTWQI